MIQWLIVSTESYNIIRFLSKDNNSSIMNSKRGFVTFCVALPPQDAVSKNRNFHCDFKLYKDLKFAFGSVQFG